MNTRNTNCLLASTLALSLIQSASAGIITFTNQVLWSAFSTVRGAAIVQEDFNSFSGFYESPMAGSTGPVTWSAIADGGIYVDGGHGWLSPNIPTDLLFSFSAGSANIQGVSGNIFATDIAWALTSAIIQVTLADGNAYAGFSTNPYDFIGFYSTGAAISSVTISATSLTEPPAFATIDNLYFAVVPAQGSLALLLFGGLVARRVRK